MTVEQHEIDVEAEISAEEAALQEELDAGEQEQGQEQSPADAAAIAEASSKGWLPEDKYKGEPGKWVDAATFLDRGKKFNKNLQAEMASLKEQLAQFKGTAEAFKKFHKESMENKDAEIKAALVELRKQKSVATREGDDDAVIVLEDRMEVLKADQEKLKEEAAIVATPAVDPKTLPIMQEWIADGNEWFRDDAKMMNYATSLAEELKAKGDTTTGRVFLDKITALMKEEFPKKFPVRSRTTAVESGGSGGVTVGGKTSKDLPADDRKLMKQFVAEGWTTEAEFLKNYRW